MLSRYKITEQFLDAIGRPISWQNEYALHLSGRLPLARSMALLRPELYREESGQEKSAIRGRRSFNQSSVGKECESNRFWGYNCPFGTPLRASADHVFPYSLGGITAGPNLLWLCDLHNRLKGSDVHVFPWELGLPTWVNGALQRIEPLVRGFDIEP